MNYCIPWSDSLTLVDQKNVIFFFLIRFQSLSMLETDEMSATSYRHKIDALLTAGAANLGCSKYSTALGHLGDLRYL